MSNDVLAEARNIEGIINVPIYKVDVKPEASQFDGMNVEMYTKLMSLPLEERYSALDAETKSYLWQYQLLSSFGGSYRDKMEDLRPDMAALGKACHDTALQEESPGGFEAGSLGNFRPVLVRRGGDITAYLSRVRAPAL